MHLERSSFLNPLNIRDFECSVDCDLFKGQKKKTKTKKAFGFELIQLLKSPGSLAVEG